MPRTIEIEGALVRIVDRKIVREATLADIMPFIETREAITMPVLPVGTRAVHWNPVDPTHQYLEVIVEVEPKVRTLTMQADAWRRAGADGNKTHRVSLPYTLFHFKMQTNDPTGNKWRFDDYRCFFAPEPFTNLDHEVIPALLPNVFEDGRICFGDTGTDAEQTIANRINAIVNEWYVSNFNNIGHTREHYLPWNSPDFDKWVRESALNQFCWKHFPEFDITTPEAANHRRYKVKDLFKQELTRTTVQRLEGSIPELPIALTFGRAEEWLQSLNATQRDRLRTAFTMIETPAIAEAG